MKSWQLNGSGVIGARREHGGLVFRTVLVAVPTLAAAHMLMDAATLLAADRRVSTFFTVVPGANGNTCRDVREFLCGRGCRVLDWTTARRSEFDLVLAAGPRGLAQLSAKSVLFPVGDVERTDAVPKSTVVGDLCYDRLLASIPFRVGYRRAFGLSRGQRLVLVSSWPGGSDVDGQSDLLARLLAALPSARYRIAAVVPPEVWSEYGGWQVRAWFAGHVRAGLLLVTYEAWRATLLAANVVVGDGGLVTRYAAAIGLPVLTVNQLDDRPALDQIDAVMTGQFVRQSVEPLSSQPGRAAELVRQAMYRLLDIREPAQPVPCPPLPAPRFVHDGLV